MGESSACLLRSFSQPSPIFQEPPEGDPIQRALTSSVSFGRFVSESLAWEKWSAFNQNRYLEEAEKFSKPGSVAQKKAYFEAQYKKIAAKKAASLCEEQSTQVENASVVNMTNEDCDDSPLDMEPAQECEHIKVEETLVEDTFDVPVTLPVNAKQQCLSTKKITESNQTKEVELTTEDPIFVENEVDMEVLVENTIDVSVSLPANANQQSLHTEKITESTQTKEVELETEVTLFEGNEVCASNQLQVDTNSYGNLQMKVHSKDAFTMGDSASSEKNEDADSLGKLPKHDKRSKNSYIRTKIPSCPTKDVGQVTSKTTKGQSLQRKKLTPNSLHMSINFTSCAYDLNKTSSPAPKKNVGSRLFKRVAAKTSNGCSDGQPPTRTSTSGISKHLSAIPQLDKGRTISLLDRSIPHSSRDLISKSPSMHIQKSKITSGSKARSPSLYSSFGLRSEERAAKRKEFFQKIEQKFNRVESEKEPHKSKHKEKVIKIPTDVCQSISSKAAAKADLPLGKKSAGTAKVSILMSSPKIERKQTSFEAHDNNSRPPWRLSMKTDNFRDAAKRNPRPPAYSAKSVAKKTLHENTSPNIQL